MKILVTGGAGFIGSHVSKFLLARGDEVVVVDNFNDYYNPVFKEKNLKDLHDIDGFSLHRVDIEDFSSIYSVFKEEAPDKVIHLAARAGVRPSIEDPILYSNVNNTGTTHLLELAKMFDVKNFVFASSSSVYGNTQETPFREDMNVDFPVSPYAATKKAGELLCHVYNHLHGLNTTCLRFFTVYGPGGRPDMAPFKFVDAIHHGRPLTKYGDGSSRRDYTYIDDIVSGVVGSLDADFEYEILNLGNSDTISLNDFIATIEDVVGKKAIIEQYPKQPGDVDLTYADVSKAREKIGYDPQYRIKDGMENFYEWYLENVVQ